MIKQLSVFIENKPGRLCEVTGYLAEAQVNIHAMSLADTMNYGILRLIVNDTEKAETALKERGLTVRTSSALAVALTHQPGSLYGVLGELDKVGASIEYMYAFTSRSSDYDAMVVLCLANQDEVVGKLQSCRVNLIGDEVIAKL